MQVRDGEAVLQCLAGDADAYAVLVRRYEQAVYATAFYYPGIGVFSGRSAIGILVMSLDFHIDAIFDIEIAPNLAFLAGLDFALPLSTTTSVITSSEDAVDGDSQFGGFSLRSFVGFGYRSSWSES